MLSTPIKRSAVLLLALLALSPLGAGADSVSQLQQKINDRNQKIQQLEAEIAGYQKTLNQTSAQTQTLKGELGRLDTQAKKLNADIKVTENKIDRASLTIAELADNINDQDQLITEHEATLASALRNLANLDQLSLVEVMLSTNRFGDFAADQERLSTLEGTITSEIGRLRDLKTELGEQKSATEKQKAELATLQNKLGDQKKIVVQNQQAKNVLLKETQNTEAKYRDLVAARQAEKAAFEKELFDFESQLKIAIDQSKLPAQGSRPLAWPLDLVFVTQYFGRTIDAARLYVSGTHNGIDLRASVGTPIKAAAAGVVKATGNTDLQTGCYSYGQWILLEHPNGLSTLYGHLSLIKVSAGQTVERGELIGYSGQTGYATGPHLHLSVLATEGVRVTRYASSLHCQQVIIPMADPKAYLDPMLYLPGA